MEPKWYVDVSNTETGSKLFEPFDYEQYTQLQQDYFRLSGKEKGVYRGIDQYIESHGGPVLTPLMSNYKKMIEEVNNRLCNTEVPSPLLIDTMIEKDSIFDLLSSLEDESYIKDLYKRKKLLVKDGLNTKTSTILVDCIRQGRSLLQAGKNAEMLAKPLIDFYAASTYAYAIIVIHSPLHKSIDSLKGSHGHTYNHATGTIDFGGDIPSGTFLDLLGAIPVMQINNSNINIKYSLMDSIQKIQNSSIKLSLVTLLSMVPELNPYYIQFDPTHKLVHQVSIDTQVVNTSSTYNFYIGNGTYRPDPERLKHCFPKGIISEIQGSYKISVDSKDISSIKPTIYQDFRGDLWYIESPIDDVVLPEICLYFLIISALCNIMRYSPHNWSEILGNKISSRYSLLISKFIRLFEMKYPMIISQYLTNYIPLLYRSLS